MKNNTLVTDYYEITMSQPYYEQGKKDQEVCFDVFFRKNPFQGGYLITAGLGEIIEYLKNFEITEEDIAYLKERNQFSNEFLESIRGQRFHGDVYAMEEGTPAFPNEPVITVKAPLVEAQIAETAILAAFNYGSLIATAAKRVVNEAKGRPVMEFGARRGSGIEGATLASKYAYMAGCCGTSNTEAGKRYGIPVLGTMAHSFVQLFDTEYEAFLAYAKAFPDNCVLLVDTYDTLHSGILNAIRVSKEYLEPNGYRLKGIRIDSGDLVYLTKAAKQLLVEAGMEDTSICVSNSLDEHKIQSLLQQGAVIDSFGIGDNILSPNDHVGGVYKLVATTKDGEFIPKIKVSEDTVKTTNPGFKRVYRFYDRDEGKVLGDVVAMFNENISTDHYTLISDRDPWKRTELHDYHLRELQVPIFQKGELVYQEPTLEEKRAYCAREFATLTDRITDIKAPHTYYVDLSDKERELKVNLLENVVKYVKEVQGHAYVKKGK